MTRREALDYLNLPEGATTEEIKARYLELLDEFNPEQYKDPGMRALSERRMDDLNKAYDALTSDRFTGARDFDHGAENKQSQSGRRTYRTPGSDRDSGDGQARWTSGWHDTSREGGNWTSWGRGSSGCGADPCCSPLLLCCCLNTFCRRC